MSLLLHSAYLAVLVPLLLAAVLAAGVRLWGRNAPWIALLGPLVLLGVGAASLPAG